MRPGTAAGPAVRAARPAAVLAAVLAAVALAGLAAAAPAAAGPAGRAVPQPTTPAPAGHAPPEVRPPGVPPPVDLRALPTAREIATLPYVVHNQVTEQAGPVRQKAACLPSAGVPTAGGPDLAAEPDGQWQLRITQAHTLAAGRGQVVAVIDSGVNPHPRLRDRLIDGGDYIENRSGLFDCDGHGTVVAGIVAAAPDPATGFVGVAPQARILSIRQGSTFYSVPLRQLATGQEFRNETAGDTSSMARAVSRAVRLGATVINISEAACFPAEPDQINAPDLQAAVHDAVRNNVVVVVAAANEGDCMQNPRGAVTTISSPGWFDEDVLTVAAADADGTAASFSMRGPWVDVAAPGTGGVSLDPGGPGLTSVLVDAAGSTRALDGTSFAAPYVAGLAALVRERFPELSAQQVMRRIELTAAHGKGEGRSEDLGYGLVDPVAALTAVIPSEHLTIGTDRVHHGRLTDLRLPAETGDRPRALLLAGSAATAALAGFAGYAVARHRGRRASSAGAAPDPVAAADPAGPDRAGAVTSGPGPRG